MQFDVLEYLILVELPLVTTEMGTFDDLSDLYLTIYPSIYDLMECGGVCVRLVIYLYIYLTIYDLGGDCCPGVVDGAPLLGTGGESSCHDPCTWKRLLLLQEHNWRMYNRK